MNVNLNSISLQQRKFSGTNSIGGIHLPDFNDKYVFSKKKSNTSNAEYKKQITEQAYEDFKNGQFQNKSEGFNKLMKKYTSEVSPDRKGIITSGLKAVSRNKQSYLQQSLREKLSTKECRLVKLIILNFMKRMEKWWQLIPIMAGRCIQQMQRQLDRLKCA